MSVKRRRGGSRYWTTQRIATTFACTAAVAATIAGLYALYRKRKSLKAMMNPRVQKLTPEQRETFVKESHNRKLRGNTPEEVVERADEAVREARRAAATRRRRHAQRRRTKKRAKRKRSSSANGYVIGGTVIVVLALLAAYAHAVAKKSRLDALTKLADMHYSGEDMPKDLTKAAELYTKAAEQGNVEAMTKLADMYYHGIGIPKNLTKAGEWFGKVSKYGPVGQHSDAIELIGMKKRNTNCSREWIHVGGGGDCLFRCLAYLQYGDPEQHFKVRTELCDYKGIFDFPIRLNSKMRNEGEWGDSYFIHLASEKYKKKIIVCSDDTHEVENYGNNTNLHSSTVPPNADTWYIKNQGVGGGGAGNHYIVSKS